MAKSKYPERPQCFAHKFTRLLANTNAAAEIGTDAVLLVVMVAHEEDRQHYSGPVAIFNDQLCGWLDIRKWKRLDNARRKAVGAGWLVYASPPNGAHEAGKYYAAIPGRFADIEESTSAPYPKSGHGAGYGQGETISQKGIRRGVTAYPIPKDPIPKQARAPSKRSEAKIPNEAKLDELIDGINALPRGFIPRVQAKRSDPIVTGWTAVQGSTEILEAFSDDEKPIKLREAFSDVPRIIQAIREASFAHRHRKKWFKLVWLFGKSGKPQERNIGKLLSGNYRDDNSNGTGRSGQGGRSHGTVGTDSASRIKNGKYGKERYANQSSTAQDANSEAS